jgi:cellulose synthase/poly-beta-1,6-N-acetylglucosamine synthase-like glycosyltransferase
MPLFLSILLGIVLLDIILILCLTLGLERLSTNSFRSTVPQIPVTLIVPFRNEREHLASLILDLRSQSYPVNLLEVIFVDDHSEDGSPELLRGLIGDLPRFRAMELKKGETGKKRALALGVAHASSEWIIQTDADCRMGPHFIEAHLSCKQETRADLVAGMVSTMEVGPGWLEALERLDLLSLTGVAAGSFYWGMPLMCSGANLAFSRALYEDTRRFEPDRGIASGDDMFLMIGARKLGRKLVYLPSKEALVKTYPATSLGSMIRQRIRWASKTPFYGQGDIQAVALLTVLAHLSVLAMPWILLQDPQRWPWLVAAFIAKSGADFVLLFIIAGYAKQRRSLRVFLPILLVYYPTQLLIWLGSLGRKVRWKGRQLQGV